MIGRVCELTDDVIRATHANKLTTAVFIDFRKAFDCDDHNILFKEMAHLGFNRHTELIQKQPTQEKGENQYLEVQYGSPRPLC